MNSIFAREKIQVGKSRLFFWLFYSIQISVHLPLTVSGTVTDIKKRCSDSITRVPHGPVWSQDTALSGRVRVTRRRIWPANGRSMQTNTTRDFTKKTDSKSINNHSACVCTFIKFDLRAEFTEPVTCCIASRLKLAEVEYTAV